VVNSSLDNVNELLRLGYGDKARLEEIKERLEKGRTLYNSDNNYLQKLMDEHGNKIQKVTESKNVEPQPEPQPEPYEQYQPEPQPESNPKPKKKSSKKEKSLTIFLILAMLVSLAILGYAIGNYTNESSPIGTVTEPRVIVEKQPEVTAPKVKTFSQMNEQELKQLAIPWNIYDMQRNPENFRGEILSISGNVFWVENIAKGKQLLAFETGCRNYECQYIVVEHQGEKLLKRDNVQVYGEFMKLAEGGAPYYWKEKAYLKSHFLECFNCN
tara:strand:+ start:126 stop:935 length:810 start_codon:yes stop_codon:yes gene_type:complete